VTADLAADIFDSDAWDTARRGGIALVVLLWLATAFWTLKDARHRLGEPWLVGLAALLGLVPFLGPFLWLFLRPPEYLEERRERELEMRVIEERLAEHDLRCPVCRGRVDSSFLVCPVCATRLKQACTECGSPLEPIWQACPYCATPVASMTFEPGEVLQPLRPRRDRA
jgi:hypothetical protein